MKPRNPIARNPILRKGGPHTGARAERGRAGARETFDEAQRWLDERHQAPAVAGADAEANAGPSSPPLMDSASKPSPSQSERTTMRYVVAGVTLPSLPVAGTDARFPVRRVYLVGRNYADHAREMGHDPDREAPFFFQKPADALLPGNADFPYPPRSSEVHHEIELVVALAAGGRDIPENAALGKVYGYAVGIDMTRRDLQRDMKKAGRPWEVGKAFDHSAPISAVFPAADIGHPTAGRIWLNVNGQPRQDGNLDQLLWNVPETIAFLSGYFELAPGDLIFTGTPAGVGPIQRGDLLTGGVEGVTEISVRIV